MGLNDNFVGNNETCEEMEEMKTENEESFGSLLKRA